MSKSVVSNSTTLSNTNITSPPPLYKSNNEPPPHTLNENLSNNENVNEAIEFTSNFNLPYNSFYNQEDLMNNNKTENGFNNELKNLYAEIELSRYFISTFFSKKLKKLFLK